MSQQAKYITDLERAVEGFLDSFDASVNGKITMTTSDGLVVEPEAGAIEAYDFAMQVMYGEEALLEDEL